MQADLPLDYIDHIRPSDMDPQDFFDLCKQEFFYASANHLPFDKEKHQWMLSYIAKHNQYNYEVQ